MCGLLMSRRGKMRRNSPVTSSHFRAPLIHERILLSLKGKNEGLGDSPSGQGFPPILLLFLQSGEQAIRKGP